MYIYFALIELVRQELFTADLSSSRKKAKNSVPSSFEEKFEMKKIHNFDAHNCGTGRERGYAATMRVKK